MDLLNQKDRKDFIQQIKSDENKNRKAESLKAFEIYNDRLQKYVKDYLLSQYSENTVLEYVIISAINLAKRIANKQANLYKEAPDREFIGLTEQQEDEIEKLYESSKINTALFKSNVYYQMQSQSFIKVVPKDGLIDAKVILPHHLDVIPDSMNPELPEQYILNAFDKTNYVQTDGNNQTIAEKDDYKASLEKYLVWTKDANFIFNAKGETVGEVLPNPIEQLPFIDVCGGKDFEFFVRCGQPLVDFTIQYNGALSDLQQLVKMQSFGVAVLKTSKELMPKSLQVGINKVIHLPIDPNQPVQPEFQFQSANADISGALSCIENLLSNFLSSRGLDPKLVNGKSEASKFNSGIDRLLSMISDIEASKQDQEVFQEAERKLFELIKAWSNATIGTDGQFLSFRIPDDATVNVKFFEPTMIQSEQEKIQALRDKKELGLINQQMMIAEYYGISDQEAAEKMDEINSEMMAVVEPNATEA